MVTIHTFCATLNRNCNISLRSPDKFTTVIHTTYEINNVTKP